MAVRKLYSSNQTASSFAAVATTTTEPSSGVILNVGRFPYVRLYPFGGGNDNTTGSLQIVGWTQQATINAAGAITPNGQWVPTIIGRADFTLSTSVGVADGLVSATERYADTITLGTVGASTRLEAASNALNTPAHLMFNPLAFDRVEVQVIIGTATSVNVLYEEMST